MKIREPQQLWRTALAQIEIKMDAPAQFRTFFSEATLINLDGKRAFIGVPNPYTADWLKTRYQDLIKETLTYVYGEPLVPEFQVTTKVGVEEESEKVEDSLFAIENGIMSSVMKAIEDSGLNIKYSMTNFVIGNPNRIAHAAAMAVIDRPGEVYNPLFVHGKTGVGKTHLAQAIARSLLERNLSKKVLYVTSENFLNEMIRGIKTMQMEKFKKKYRSLDILIIDDMQLISKWVQTQEEFFNTFNGLYNAGKQIIMVADRKPDDIKNIEARIKSRMQGGMVVELSQPDYEMRLAIVQRKSEALGIQLNSKILEFIARAITDNVRELEGALQKVSLFNQMKPDGDLTLEEVAHTLGVDSKSKRDQVKVPKILREVGKSFNITVKDIKGPGRKRDVALARQVVMYILREEYNYKLEDVAKLLNRQDHTTVIHAIDKIKSKMMIQDEFNYQVSKVISAINDGVLITEDIEE
jgi:chromosomal replication initiator protein